jgi:hypothetical protein
MECFSRSSSDTGQQRVLEVMEGFQPEIAEVAATEEQELFWKITLSSGLHVVRARIAWCREARSMLEQWQHSTTQAEP